MSCTSTSMLFQTEEKAISYNESMEKKIKKISRFFKERLAKIITKFWKNGVSNQKEAKLFLKDPTSYPLEGVGVLWVWCVRVGLVGV